VRAVAGGLIIVRKGRQEQQPRAGGGIARALAVMMLGAFCFGCSNNPNKPNEVVESNVVPANYRDQIASFLSTVLTDNADFRNALIAPPVLKPVGANQHYVACVQLNGYNQHKDKAIIYFAGSINQVVDATPEECGGAAYGPFPELAHFAQH
jgi:hypothetical protein